MGDSRKLSVPPAAALPVPPDRDSIRELRRLLKGSLAQLHAALEIAERMAKGLDILDGVNSRYDKTV